MAAPVPASPDPPLLPITAPARAPSAAPPAALRSTLPVVVQAAASRPALATAIRGFSISLLLVVVPSAPNAALHGRFRNPAACAPFRWSTSGGRFCRLPCPKPLN